MADIDLNHFSSASEVIDYLKTGGPFTKDEQMKIRENIYERIGIDDPMTLTEERINTLQTRWLEFLLKDKLVVQPQYKKQLMRAEISRRKRGIVAGKKIERPVLTAYEKKDKDSSPETKVMTDKEYKEKLVADKQMVDLRERREDASWRAVKWLGLGLLCAFCLLTTTWNFAIGIGCVVLCAILFAINLYESR